jgi:hypothetical protein
MAKPKAVTAKMILEMIEHQGRRCALSGRELTPETASLDHIMPLSRGGVHDLGNLWVVDHRVNTAKGTLTVDEFIALCQEVTDHHKASLSRRPVSIGTSEN